MQIIRIPPGGIMFEEGNVKFPATDNVADQAAVVYAWRRRSGSSHSIERVVEDVVAFNCQRMGFHRKFCSENLTVELPGKDTVKLIHSNSTPHRNICKTCGARI